MCHTVLHILIHIIMQKTINLKDKVNTSQQAASGPVWC